MAKTGNKTKRSRQVVVSGATGFIGRHLIPILLQNNYTVIATARNMKLAETFEWYPNVTFIPLDFHKQESEIEVEPGAGLIHLAWQGLPNYTSLSHFEENLPHNYHFIKSLLSVGVQQVLIAGTCFEYGLQSGPVSSSTPARPINPYAASKDSLRVNLEFLARQKPFTLQWARLFYMFGEGQSELALLPQVDAAIERGEVAFNMSGGEQLRDYLPVEAVAQQLFDLYTDKKAGLYNICSGHPISVRRLVERHITARKSSITPNLGYYPYPEHEPMAFWGVRDIGETIYLPALPNAPLSSKTDKQPLAPMRLRYNESLGFLENEAFDPDLIDYSQNYENSQAHSDRFLAHMNEVLGLLKGKLPQGSLIVEVGCGKGDFVELVLADGYFRIQGYDASYEGHNAAIEKRYLHASDTIQADIVVLRHVLEHVPQPHNFLAMLRMVFGHAQIYIEVPNYDWIKENGTYFDITYEHVNYFSQFALKALFEQHQAQYGLLFDRQYQYVISSLSEINPDFNNKYNSEKWCYKTFEELFPDISQKIERIEKLAGSHSIFVWGAATKGCLFLAHCTVRRKLIEQVVYAVDVNPNKIGKFLPGSRIEIKSKREFFNFIKDDDVLLISNPAYKIEIVAELRGMGITGIIVETL